MTSPSPYCGNGSDSIMSTDMSGRKWFLMISPSGCLNQKLLTSVGSRPSMSFWRSSSTAHPPPQGRRRGRQEVVLDDLAVGLLGPEVLDVGRVATLDEVLAQLLEGELAL